MKPLPLQQSIVLSIITILAGTALYALTSNHQQITPVSGNIRVDFIEDGNVAVSQDRISTSLDGITTSITTRCNIFENEDCLQALLREIENRGAENLILEIHRKRTVNNSTFSQEYNLKFSIENEPYIVEENLKGGITKITNFKNRNVEITEKFFPNPKIIQH